MSLKQNGSSLLVFPDEKKEVKKQTRKNFVRRQTVKVRAYNLSWGI